MTGFIEHKIVSVSDLKLLFTLTKSPRNNDQFQISRFLIQEGNNYLPIGHCEFKNLFEAYQIFNKIEEN